MMKKNRADLAGDRLGIPLSWSHLATGSCSSEPPDPCSCSCSCSGCGSCRSCPSRPTSPRLRLWRQNETPPPLRARFYWLGCGKMAKRNCRPEPGQS